MFVDPYEIHLFLSTEQKQLQKKNVLYNVCSSDSM
jgi:hypothetical protein